MTDWLQSAGAIRRELFARFLEPETQQLVTYSEHWKKGHIPTPDEAAAAVPNGPSYSTGIEDGTLRGSALLAVLCDEYNLTRDPDIRAQAHTIFQGLRRAQDAADPPGFVPRWVLADGRGCYPNSSGDQHTILIYGLWRYVQSPMATDAQRQAAAAIADRVLRRLREHDWRVVAKDGTDAHAGGRLQSARLLAVLLGGHRITADDVWRRHFDDLARTDLEADMRRMLGDGPGTPSGWGFYGPQQHAELLTILVDEESDAQRRELWRRTRTEIARRFLHGPIPTEHHRPLYSDACRKALGDAAHIATPFDVLHVFKPELWGLDEDRDWRRDYREWTGGVSDSGPTSQVLWWLGRRPALCHERNCVISPLVAFHVAHLCDDAALVGRVRDAVIATFDRVDITQAGKLCSLTAAHAVAVLAARLDM